MVRDPATDPLCRECGVRSKCKEFGEVCTPINVNINHWGYWVNCPNEEQGPGF